MGKIIYLALLCLSFNSCFTVGRIKYKKFHDCIDKIDSNHVKGAIETGAYSFSYLIEDSLTRQSSIFVFYENGVFLEYQNINVLHNDLARKKWSKSYNSGLFSIKNDSIFVNYFYVSPATSLYGHYMFKIIDEKSIVLLQHKNYENPNYFDSLNLEYRHFEYDSLLPVNDVWLVNKRWAWCDKKVRLK